MLPLPFRTIGKHSGASSGTIGILLRRIRLLRIGFCMPLREYMRIHVERTRWQSFAHLLINDTERFPKLANFYRQLLQSIGAVVDGRHYTCVFTVHERRINYFKISRKICFFQSFNVFHCRQT